MIPNLEGVRGRVLRSTKLVSSSNLIHHVAGSNSRPNVLIHFTPAARRNTLSNDPQAHSHSSLAGSHESRRGQPSSDVRTPTYQSPFRAPILMARSKLHCEVCQNKNRGEQMLLCDGCDCGRFCGSIFETSSISLIVNVTLGFHTFCLDPPLSNIPKGQWFCHVCLFGTGGDFGFDEGEEHSLSSFQARDTEFRQQWFKMHPPPANSDSDHVKRYSPLDPAINRFGDVLVSETDVENEFWRLVQSQAETVEVEYGADVHSTTHGR